MTTSKFLSKNKKGMGLIGQTMSWVLVMALLSMFVSVMADDYTSVEGGMPSNPTQTSLTGSFFSSAPVFAGLPYWALVFYGILGIWGIVLGIGWILAILHGISS